MKSFKIRDLMIDVQPKIINLAENHNTYFATCVPVCTKTCLPQVSKTPTKPKKPKGSLENSKELARLKKTIANLQEKMPEYA